MAAYILIYIITASSILVEHVSGVSDRHKKQTMLILLFLLTLFRGLRWETGTDWYQFQGVFDTIDFGSIFGIQRYTGVSLEPGYAFLNWLFSVTTGSYSVFLLSYNAVILGIYYSCSWRYAPQRPIYVFVSLVLFTAIFPLRQGIACAIFFYSFRYIFSRDLLKYGLCILAAASMHNSAILLFPFYFIMLRRFPIWLLAALYVICLLLSLTPFLNKMLELATIVIAPIVGVESSLLYKVTNYVLIHEKETGSGIKVLVISVVRSALFIALFGHFRSHFERNNVYNLFLNAFFIALYIGTLFKYQMQEIMRMQDYFVFGFCILCGLILNHLPKNKRILLYSFLLLYAIYTFNKWFGQFYEEVVPYKSIWGAL